MVDFWCNNCRVDLKLRAVRRWINSKIGKGWVATCTGCYKTLYRYDNSEITDPYYRQSRFIQRERRKLRDDLLQPGDPGFELLYPQHKKERLQAIDRE